MKRFVALVGGFALTTTGAPSLCLASFPGRPPAGRSGGQPLVMPVDLAPKRHCDMLSAGMPAPPDPADLDAVIEESHRVLDAFFKGDANPVKPLFSRRDDVSLANPFGPPRRGWSEVEDALERAAANYRNGRVIGFEQVSKYVTPELGYIVEIEHYQAKVGGSEEVTPVSLRCTTVFRREDDGWRIVHRHADPITTPRTAESVVQS